MGKLVPLETATLRGASFTVGLEVELVQDWSAEYPQGWRTRITGMVVSKSPSGVQVQIDPRISDAYGMLDLGWFRPVAKAPRRRVSK